MTLDDPEFQDYEVKKIAYKNISEISFVELETLQNEFSKTIQQDYCRPYLIKYLSYLKLLKAFQEQNESEIQNVFKEWKQNQFIQAESLKIQFHLGEKLNDQIQFLKEIKLLNYLLRRGENFQLYYSSMYNEWNLNDKIGLFSNYFSFLQDKKWFLALLIPLLFQYRDFSNCFSVSRRLYDCLETFINKTETEIQEEEKNQSSLICEGHWVFLLVSKEKLIAKSNLFDDEFLKTNVSFQNNFLQQLLLSCKLTQKFTLADKIIENLIDSEFPFQSLGYYLIKEKNLKDNFIEFLSQFILISQQKIDGNLDLKIEQLDVLAEKQNFQQLKSKISPIQNSLDDTFICSPSYLNPIYKLLDHTIKSVPEQINRISEKFALFIKSLDEYLIKNPQSIELTFALPFIIKIGLLLRTKFDLNLINKIINIQSDSTTFLYNQTMLKQNSLDLECDLTAKQFKNLYFDGQILPNILFYSYNQEKENTFTWMLLTRYLINQNQYELAKQSLQKVQYLIKDNEDERHLDYFSLLILDLRRHIQLDDELKVNPKFIRKFRKMDFKNKVSRIKEEKLLEDINIKWMELDYKSLVPLVLGWVYLKLRDGKINEVVDKLINCKNILKERQNELSFEHLQKVQGLEELKIQENLLKIISTLNDSEIDQGKKQHLQNLKKVVQNNQDWRSLIVKIRDEDWNKQKEVETKIQKLRKNLLSNFISIDKTSFKQNDLLQLILKTINELRKDQGQNSFQKMKYFILKQPNLLTKFRKHFDTKTIQRETKETEIKETKWKQIFEQNQENILNGEFISGRDVWKKTKNIHEALITTLNNCKALENDKLNKKQKEKLCELIFEDLNLDKSLSLPLMRYLYSKEEYQKLEELLIQMNSFKIGPSLEHYLNFYVFLFKMKNYELSEEITEDQEFEIDELYHYFEQENCSLEMKAAVKYLYSLFGLLIKKEKNLISNVTSLRFSILRQPNLFMKGKRFASSGDLII